MAIVNLSSGGDGTPSSPYTSIDLDKLIAEIKAQAQASNASADILSPQYYGSSNPASSLSASTIQNPPMPPSRPTNAAGAGLQAFHNNTATGQGSLPTSAPQAQTPQPQSANQMLNQGQDMNPIDILLQQLFGIKHGVTGTNKGVLSNLFGNLGSGVSQIGQGLGNSIANLFGGGLAQTAQPQANTQIGVGALDKLFSNLSDSDFT